MFIDPVDECVVLPSAHQSILHVSKSEFVDALTLARSHGVEVSVRHIPHDRQNPKHKYSHSMEILSLEQKSIIQREVLVDSGATCSIVKSWFAAEMGWTYHSMPNEIFTDFKGESTGSQFCLNEPLFVFNGGRNAQIRFRVVESDKRFDSEAIMLGAPEMELLGIGIHGLQVAFPSTLQALTSQDEEPWIANRTILSTPPDVILSESEQAFIESEKSKINLLLAENNLKCPIDGHCSHPNKYFSIKLIDGAEKKFRFEKPYSLDADSQSALNVLSSDAKGDFEHWLQRQQFTLDIDRPWLRAYIKRRSEKMADDFAKSHKQAPLEPIPIGTLVMVLDVNRASKNESPYVGPYTIKSFDEITQSYQVTDSLGSVLGRRLTVDMMKILPLARKPEGDEFYVDKLLNQEFS